ncbi:MAG TPA: TonB-dependent receptor [Burkholderiaceae bacterium]|nr:TonB-dependent receptor [Burkholderiaceae bacterium]
MSNPIKAAQSFNYLADGSFHGGDKRLSGSQLKDVAPSVEKIAAQAGVPLKLGAQDGLSSQGPRGSTNTGGEALGHSNDPKANNEKAQLIVRKGSANSEELDGQLRQLVNSTVRRHELKFSWMPEPVTLEQAYEKLGVDSIRGLLQKISAGDPAALDMGFRPEDRAFYSRQFGEAQLEAAKLVALAIVDSRVGAASASIGSDTSISALLGAQAASSRFELEMKAQQPGHEPATTAFQEKNALARSAKRQAQVVKELAGDLRALGTPTAKLVWATATNTGLIDPTVDTNDPAFVESLKVSPKRMARATLDTVAAQASGELAQWPAGPVQFAAGASVAREQLADTPDPLLQSGQVVGAIAQSAVDAARNNLGVFVELSMPLAAQLESQLALRFDRYGSVSAASPKAALAWRATPHWLVRSSYSRSFRAPGLKQLYGAQEQSAATVTDPVQCQILVGASPCTQAVFQVSGAHAGLEPEKASTSNIGTVFEWKEGRAQLDASVDLWRISKDKSIDTPSLDTAIREGLFTQVGPQYFVFTRLFNLAQLVSAGVDVDWRVRWPTSWGRVSLHNTSTYILTYKKRKPGEDWADYKGTYARPIWRNRVSVSLDRAAWGAQLTVRSVGGFSDSDLPKPHPSGTREVGAYEELDVQLSYAGLGGVRGLTLTGGIKNLMDRQPPFSLQNVTSNSYSQMGFAEIYDNRGRFYYLSANYQF